MYSILYVYVYCSVQMYSCVNTAYKLKADFQTLCRRAARSLVRRSGPRRRRARPAALRRHHSARDADRHAAPVDRQRSARGAQLGAGPASAARTRDRSLRTGLDRRPPLESRASPPVQRPIGEERARVCVTLYVQCVVYSSVTAQQMCTRTLFSTLHELSVRIQCISEVPLSEFFQIIDDEAAASKMKINT